MSGISGIRVEELGRMDLIGLGSYAPGIGMFMRSPRRLAY